MQILIGLSAIGHLRHTELLAGLHPLQIVSLVRARAAEFARVEVWEDAVCVARFPPSTGKADTTALTRP